MFIVMYPEGILVYLIGFILIQLEDLMHTIMFLDPL